MRPLLCLLCASVLVPATAHAAAGDAAFDALVDEYYAGYPAVYPTSATELGLHEHDGDLEDLSPAALARESKRLRGWDARLAKVDAQALSPARAVDLAFLRSSIASMLLELDRRKSWARRPDLYSGLATRSVYVIIKRDFAPLETRLAAVLGRLAKVPRLLEQGKRNLTQAPRVAYQIALDQLPGTIDFFKRDLPLAFEKVKDDKARARLEAAIAKVVAALEGYRAFLKQKEPRAPQDFAIGEALFRDKLKADEMIDEPIDALLARGEAELRRLKAELDATAARIDAKKPARQILEEVQRDHVAPDKLIASVQGGLSALRKFLVDKKIVAIPSPVMPIVQETPPFMRATTMASMETPGPFEKKATEAYYNVTLPEPGWPAEKVEDFMRGAFSRTLVDIVSIHEAFPGHYVQFLWVPQLASKVRRFEAANSNAEGWAHYCEQMILDEGWGNGDPRLRLSQLQDALLRAARYVVGIRMHTRGMSFSDAVAYFHDEALQTREVALLETRRGTYDPTYLYYTLGKLEILRLREDYKKKLGPAYSLEKFHNALLAEGAIPLPLLRKVMLSN